MTTITLDFETQAIENGNPIPPKPVGYAYKVGNNPGHYISFGHSDKNTHTWDEAKKLLQDLIVTLPSTPVIFHNAKFDVGVCKHWFKFGPMGDVHDTMFLAFLANPHETSLSLKPMSAKYLKMPAEEQADLRDWVMSHVKGTTEKNWGAFISEAPADLVGKYAIGDVDRTKGLFDLLYPAIEEDHKLVVEERNSMLAAYKTEVSLLRVIREMETVGVPLSKHIDDELEHWQASFNDGEALIKTFVGDDVTFGGKLMFNRLKERGLIDESKLQYTDKGNARYGREFLDDLVNNDQLATALKRRSKLTKMLGTYLRPWVESKQLFGRLHPYFNQTRNLADQGTRTGRFSSNLQQIPKLVEDGYPNLRALIVPEDGEILLVRDFSAQEIRVAAHFAEGSILKAYQDDPDLDVHTFVQTMIKDKVGIDLPRRISKTVTFLKLYGGGAQKLVDQIGCTIEEAKSFFAAYEAALPEFKNLTQQTEKIIKAGRKIRTWGGRLYDVEPAEIRPDGRKWEKYYKLPNTLIQGSSADMTKHAMLRYFHHPKRKGRLILQVHDELVVSVKPEFRISEMELLRWAMNEQTGWDVPIRSTGEWGYNYAELIEMEHELS
jgi:DNA polymerase I